MMLLMRQAESPKPETVYEQRQQREALYSIRHGVDQRYCDVLSILYFTTL